MTQEGITLRAAWEQSFREWPGREAPREAWLVFHRRSVELFRRAAQFDVDHPNEARFWFAMAIRGLRELEARGE